MLNDKYEIECAKELKVAFVTVQDRGAGQSPYFVLGDHSYRESMQ